MRTIFCHVEEHSMDLALQSLLPRIIDNRAKWKIINHGSKSQLLKNISQRLEGYKDMARTKDLGILILVDRDREDCHELKEKLERMASNKGLATKKRPDYHGHFLVVNRVVVEELEAWFFGDIDAVRKGYPRIPATFGNNKKYQDPDAIRGGTWEALHREMKKAGYFKDHFPKHDVARNISANMVPSNNISSSFQAFKSGLEALLALPPIVEMA
ncbi:MAG: DUF4276 family protein [Magnetococcales bacterium]|nr:DUF4276 family protein [Magnetococcales bacterium]MBF0155862.1 DUF4276 family protein [Magnetococcales bacterium]